MTSKNKLNYGVINGTRVHYAKCGKKNGNGPRMQINLRPTKKTSARNKSLERTIYLIRYFMYCLINIIAFVPKKIFRAAKFISYDSWHRIVLRKKICNFTWRFALMIESGLPLVTVLNILGNAARGKFAKAVFQIKYDVESGMILAEAMEKTKAFPIFYVQMIQAGEVGGVLDTILFKLNDYYRLKISSRKNVIRFSWMMGMMLESGVPILESLKITADMFPYNRKFAKAIMAMRNKVAEGHYFYEAMMESQPGKFKTFPEIFVQMATVGENSGCLDQMLKNFAKYSMENEK